MSLPNEFEGNYSLLDVASPVPLFHQLRDLLESWFQQAFTVDDDLPTEKEITEKFGVSRITVRRALDEMISENIVVRPKSRGRLRLRKLPPVQRLNRLRGFFTDDLLAAGMKPSTKTISFSRVINERINAELKLSPKAECFCIERLHYAAEQPIAHQISWIPVDLLPELETYDFSQSLMALFDKSLPHPIYKGEQQLLVRNSTIEESQHLGLSVGTAIISVSRVAFMDNNQAAEYFVATMNPKFYQFSMTVYADE
ncbi:GntR family transcriptional regulator [Raoultella sp. BIGb0138]|uniref:GntR family transcriptional regulator n=1 Tax=Raoultella sp. BIGb0138 TaxID=2485115 RepID=UPI001053C300|nr:GntR family transcriptional regulator [Raoultella sp. BIGb0138]TCW17575.1 GntR family transcriptional regulator [Raoultella sp. BIGb0138]